MRRRQRKRMDYSSNSQWETGFKYFIWIKRCYERTKETFLSFLFITTNARAEILNFAIDIHVASSSLKDTNQEIKKQRQYLNNDASFLLNDSDGFEHFKRKFSSLQGELFNVAGQVLHALEKQREGAMESDGLFLNKNNIQTRISTEQNAEVWSFPVCLKET